MKTYLFEGREYVESGEYRLPRRGEIHDYFPYGGAHRANHDYDRCRYKILIPKEEKMEGYETLKDITIDDILGLEESGFKDECIRRLSGCGFIKKRLKTYRSGQRFRHKEDGDMYLLCRTDLDRVNLIGLERGIVWRWGGGVELKHGLVISELEFLEIVGSDHEFELVEGGV